MESRRAPAPLRRRAGQVLPDAGAGSAPGYGLGVPAVGKTGIGLPGLRPKRWTAGRPVPTIRPNESARFLWLQPTAQPGFVHLHVPSAYSLLEGALTISKLAELAKADKQPALALTDTDNMFGALEFSEKLAGYGIQPIVGMRARGRFRR